MKQKEEAFHASIQSSCTYLKRLLHIEEFGRLSNLHEDSNADIWASQLLSPFCRSPMGLNLNLFNGCILLHSRGFSFLSLDAVLNLVWRSVNVSIIRCLWGRGCGVVWGDDNGFQGTAAFTVAQWEVMSTRKSFLLRCSEAPRAGCRC